MTAPLDDILAALDCLAGAIEKAEKAERAEQARQNQGADGRALPAGIHLEGPFLNHPMAGRTPGKLPPAAFPSAFRALLAGGPRTDQGSDHCSRTA